MVALMLLPRLGGAPAVWNTAVVFYQFLLLLGYLYAHIVSTRLSASSQVFLHAIVVLLPFLTLPVALPVGWVPPTASTPLFWVLQVLFVMVGVPFFVVSTTSPLLQSWFARTHHQTDKDPYFLYAASNTGSLVALLAYPFLVQPHLSLPMQSSVWTLGYGIFAVLVLFLAIGFWRERKQQSPEYRGLVSEELWHVQPDAITPEVNVSIDPQQRLRWILLAFVPSSLMLSVTTYLVTNIAPLPLLWMIPLMLYLLTFMWAFSRVPLPPWKVIGGVLTVLLPAVLLSLGIISANRAGFGILLHLLTFFVVALGCHGRLAQERPPARYLTEFYLWLSLGGVLGGVFTAVVAPVLFRVILEYPLMLILSVGLILWKEVDPDPREQRRDLQIPLVLGGAVCVLIGVDRWLGKGWDTLDVSALMGFGMLVYFAFSSRPLRFTVGLGMLFCAGLLLEHTERPILAMERNFFGIARVIDDVTRQYRLLIHGTTIHGVQSLDPARRREPLSYFSISSPIGQLFSTFDRQWSGRQVAIVGLGTGSLACYSKPDQYWTFYEIDPAIVRLAQDPRYFTFLRDCAPQADIILGDARLSLTAAPADYYDLIVLDAYSSDAIPVHLLTREALAIYLAKLTEHGIVAFHISNVFFDLAPVVGNLAHDAGLTALLQSDSAVSEAEQKQGKYPSVWVVVTRHAEDLLPLKKDGRWKELPAAPELAVWTDNFSSVLDVLRRWRLP
jgi:hypothetical protein